MQDNTNAIESNSNSPVADNIEQADAELDNGLETETEETPADAGDEDAPDGNPDNELKTVRKALDKRNRYINNQRNKIRSLESEVEKLKASYSQSRQPAPDMEKFDSVIDYMKADQNYNLEQKLAEQEQKAQIAALEQQQNMAIEQHAETVAAQVNELLTSNQEFKAVISSNVNVISAMPPHIEKMMMEIDNAPAATYALAKEGRLASIYSMPPHLAAAHLVQAEIRGQQYLQQSAKQTPQPPKPIGSLKGTGKASTKSPDDMSPDQLIKWLKT